MKVFCFLWSAELLQSFLQETEKMYFCSLNQFLPIKWYKLLTHWQTHHCIDIYMHCSCIDHSYGYKKKVTVIVFPCLGLWLNTETGAKTCICSTEDRKLFCFDSWSKYNTWQPHHCHLISVQNVGYIIVLGCLFQVKSLSSLSCSYLQ